MHNALAGGDAGATKPFSKIETLHNHVLQCTSVRFHKLSLFVLSILFLAFWSCGGKSVTRELPWDLYVDKVYGGWLGQMVGVQFGESTEGLFAGRMIPFEIKEYIRIIPQLKTTVDTLFSGNSPDKREKIYELIKDRQSWEVFSPNGAPDQDDIYIELTFLAALQKFGFEVQGRQVAALWLEHLPPERLWGANRAAHQNFRKGIWPPASGSSKHSPFSRWIDFQIESDLFGLISPGLPHASGKLCETFGRMMNDGEGVYAGKFVACMYSHAFFESEPVTVITNALSCIPANSYYAGMVRDVLKWHEQYPNWEDTWQKIERKWAVRSDGKPVSVLDAITNGSYILVGLLYGNGDFHRTMEITMRCGRDSDCNPSNAAGVLGCIMGARQIPEKWKGPMKGFYNNTTVPTLYPERLSHQSLVDYTTELGKKYVLLNGGSFKNGTLYIPRH